MGVLGPTPVSNMISLAHNFARAPAVPSLSNPVSLLTGGESCDSFAMETVVVDACQHSQEDLEVFSPFCVFTDAHSKSLLLHQGSMLKTDHFNSDSIPVY